MTTHETHWSPAVRDLIAAAEQRGEQAAAERVAQAVERQVGMQGFRFCSHECHGEALTVVREATRALLAAHRADRLS